MSESTHHHHHSQKSPTHTVQGHPIAQDHKMAAPLPPSYPTAGITGGPPHSTHPHHHHSPTPYGSNPAPFADSLPLYKRSSSLAHPYDAVSIPSDKGDFPFSDSMDDSKRHGSRAGIIHMITRFIRSILHDRRTRNIFFFLLLNLTFTVVEALYGVWTNSLGLTSDAIHMLFDSSAILFSLIASVVAKWASNPRFTYGYSRVETLTGFVNALAILLAGVSIVWESLERMSDPPDIKKDHLLLVSIIGFLVNLVGIFAFDHGHHHHGHGHSHSDDDHHGHSHGHHHTPSHSHHHHDHHSPNHSHHHSHHHSHSDNPLMQGMFLHILADTLGSAGVIVSSVLIELYGWTWADPVCSLFISIMILSSTWPLLKGSALILLQRVPFALEKKLPSVYLKILSIPGVLSYHSAHFWEMSSQCYVASIHIRMIPAGDDQRVRFAVQDVLDQLGCRHTVIEIEREGVYKGHSH